MYNAYTQPPSSAMGHSLNVQLISKRQIFESPIEVDITKVLYSITVVKLKYLGDCFSAQPHDICCQAVADVHFASYGIYSTI